MNPKPPSKDESLQKLKAEVELLVASGVSYAYRSPEQLFEEELVKEFHNEPDAPQKARFIVSQMKSKDPYGFTSGPHFTMNDEALYAAKDKIRKELDTEYRIRAEEARIQAEKAEAERQEKIRKKREEKEKKMPWLKNQNTSVDKRSTGGFDFGSSRLSADKNRKLLLTASSEGFHLGKESRASEVRTIHLQQPRGQQVLLPERHLHRTQTSSKNQDQV